jgi:chromosome segregation protein
LGAFEGKRIGRAKQIEQLFLDIQKLEEDIKHQQENITFAQNSLQELKKNQSLKEGLLNAQKYYQDLKEQNVILKSKKEQLIMIAQANLDKQNDIARQIEHFETQIQTFSPQSKLLKTQLEDIKINLENARLENETQQENLQYISGQFNSKNVLFFQQKNLIQKIEQELSFRDENEIEVKNRLQNAQNQLHNSEIELENLLEVIENLEKEIKNLNTQTPHLEQNFSELEQNFYKLRGQIAQKEKTIKETQRQKDLQDGIIHQIETKLHETEMSLASWKERMSVEFQMSLDDVFSAQETIENQENTAPNFMEVDLKSLVEDLRAKIDRIGTINALAMEEYNTTLERYKFIETQKTDLESAKKALLDTIIEMENFATQEFMQAFTQIRENFITVFRSLFSAEDKADLVLATPENPLESSIDIIAQPKGKRPLTIDQLSGGEKTLTAISLLFALYLLKPAPFCIFDEVDAPLDDANTEKFNKIIKEFSKDSQFIIVTHNKRTMASTDIMYGVTMLTQGISSVVPVDLRSYSLVEE